MKLPWRSRAEAVSIEDPPPEPPGPSIEIHGSPGLEEAVRGVPGDGSCKVLDMGPSVADNVDFVSSFASYLQIVDAIERGPGSDDAQGAGLGRLSTLQPLVKKHRRSFHLVLMWDVLNYLSPERAERLIQTVAELCIPGARLHAIVHSTDTMPAVPNRYRILGGSRLAYEPGTTDIRGVPNLPPSAVEKLLKGFRIEHSFVLQHGVHEYVAARKRWYVKK
jgi:hypothetical protein